MSRSTTFGASTSDPNYWFKKAQEDLERIKRLQGQPKSTPVTFKDLPKEVQEYLNNQTKNWKDPNKPNPAVTEVFGSTRPITIDDPPVPRNPSTGVGIGTDYTMLILLGAIGVGLLIIK